MKLVMTLLVRDEADVVDAQLAFHLNAGVDFVVATDNRSQDGTAEILERYERDGYLHLLRESGDDMRQEEWVTRMARLAASEFGADWVINSDADEFWWPRGGSLKDVLSAIPERFGVVRGCWRHFLPRPSPAPAPAKPAPALSTGSVEPTPVDGGFFAERMTVRLAAPAHPGDKETVFHAHQKVAHRADPNVWIEAGNHNAEGDCLVPLRGWHPLEVLHFSFRSVRQAERKLAGGWLRNRDYEAPLHQVLADDAYHANRVADYFDSFVVDDEALARGLEDGTLAIDTRLRDALRALRAGAAFLLPRDGASGLAFPRPDVPDDAVYAAEASVLVEIDGIVRAEARIEALEERLASLEREPLTRLATKVLNRGGSNGTLRRLARR